MNSLFEETIILVIESGTCCDISFLNEKQNLKNFKLVIKDFIYLHIQDFSGCECDNAVVVLKVEFFFCNIFFFLFLHWKVKKKSFI